MAIEEFENEIDDLVQWMKDSTAEPPKPTGDHDKDRDTILDDLDSFQNSDIYEVHVHFHLTNGEVLKIRNHCYDSYRRRKYAGDTAFMSDGWLYVEWGDDDEIFHQTRIKPESVCWIDSYNIEVDWKEKEFWILQAFDLLDPDDEPF